MLAVICKTGTEPMNIKIERAPELRVLGYLEPRVHKLQIANVVINVLIWHIFQYVSWAFGGTHSRVAERTNLFPEGKYSGKCQAIRPI